jgi:hypothetical protein
MLVYTSLLFLVPAVVAGWVGVGWFAMLMSGLVVTSICYHGRVFETSMCRLVDTCYACGLTATFTTVSIYLGFCRGLIMFKLAAVCGFAATTIYIVSKTMKHTRHCKMLHVCVHICGAFGFTLFVCGIGLLTK